MPNAKCRFGFRISEALGRVEELEVDEGEGSKLSSD